VVSAVPGAAELDPIAYWNGPASDRWVQNDAAIEKAFGPFGEAALAELSPRAGERVLDVGCGTGATVAELLERVGSAGQLVGIDVSRPLLELARKRLGSAPNARLLEADAASQRFDSSFDAVFSRFGVMFFPDPVAAFDNLRRALVPSGRVTFVCWQALVDNAWCTLPLEAARDVLGPSFPGPVASGPGPFAFAERGEAAGVLERAGFRSISVREFRAPVVLAAGGSAPGRLDLAADFAVRIGPVARLLADVGDAERLAVRDRVRSLLAGAASAKRVALEGATWIASARA
jgi:SAM-dependent methyltransferase